jgi:hypothetical protein
VVVVVALDFAPHHVADQVSVSAHKVGVVIKAHVRLSVTILALG